MKKILALGLAATLSAAGVAAFAGCGAEDEFVVGAIYINSQTDTAGYTPMRTTTALRRRWSS